MIMAPVDREELIGRIVGGVIAFLIWVAVLYIPVKRVIRKVREEQQQQQALTYLSFQTEVSEVTR
jgi:hypothetical protein